MVAFLQDRLSCFNFTITQVFTCSGPLDNCSSMRKALSFLWLAKRERERLDRHGGGSTLKPSQRMSHTQKQAWGDGVEGGKGGGAVVDM